MSKFILGSGLVGLLAYDILGSDYQLVPFGRSRMYSFDVPVADNYIIYDNSISDYITKYNNDLGLLKVNYSIGDQLMNANKQLATVFVDKVYKGTDDGLYSSYFSKQLVLPVAMNANIIYKKLVDKHIDAIKESINKYGKLTSISDNMLNFENQSCAYDYIINTVPYRLYSSLCGINNATENPGVHIYDMYTNSLDFDGAMTTYVIDDNMPIYKINKIGADRYLFFSLSKIDQPGLFFMRFIKKFVLVAETYVDDYISLRRTIVNTHTHIGSCAAQDDTLDVGTCIKRIMALKVL